MRKNKNRGFQKLRVWQDAIEFYKQTYNLFRNFPFELKKLPVRLSHQAIQFIATSPKVIADAPYMITLNFYTSL